MKTDNWSYRTYEPKTPSRRAADRICQVVAAICAAIALSMFVVAGWSLSTYLESDAMSGYMDFVTLVSAILPLVAAGLLVGAAHPEDENSPRIIGASTVIACTGIGVGLLAHALVDAPSVGGFVVGLLVVAVGAAIGADLERRARRRWTDRRLRERSLREGTTTVGVVTKARNHLRDEGAYEASMVTVSFADADGAQRSIRQEIREHTRAGTEVVVRYLPEHPDHAVALRPRLR